MNSMVRLRSCCSLRKRLRICAWIETSSDDTGSSQMSSSGSTASARAMPMRCNWPPENEDGLRRRWSFSRPTISRSWITRSRRSSSVLVSLWMRRPSLTMSSTLMRGLSEEYGVLEDDLHLAAQGPQVAPADVGDLFPVEEDAPGGGVHEAEDAAGGGGFARSRLSDQPHGRAPLHLEGDVVDGDDGLLGAEQVVDEELLDQFLDAEHRHAHGITPGFLAHLSAKWQALACWPPGGTTSSGSTSRQICSA